MIAVISNAWLLPGEEHAVAYTQISLEFDAVHREIGGFRGRRLMRGVDDSLHLINIRWFDSVADYDRLVADPDYATWIAKLSAHIEPRAPGKEYAEVLLDTIGPGDLLTTATQ
jgi:hypothetical protein